MSVLINKSEVPACNQFHSKRIACLPMYDMEEIHWANDALWAAIARELKAADVESVPENLTRSDSPEMLWRHPGLLLGQTCGYPLVTMLESQVQVVALFIGPQAVAELGIAARSSLQPAMPQQPSKT